MPEQRGRQYHRARVGETLKEEIGVIIEGELRDPRIALCTVTEIALAPDGKSARVYVEVTVGALSRFTGVVMARAAFLARDSPHMTLSESS